ncbi:hypothetical protein EWU23_09670 [Cytophagaceae bacterium 50C-KIRBA]|uniref:Uncharacterized protein n=1 Tax=Aquirufa beregesia TaxID=2516556 RepID=A0ABX0F4F6_9BACT|nr:hypothetical protein [Aquirufa beregesia]NGZ44745.1 hypothetical protein [Aquirufa beregesia]
MAVHTVYSDRVPFANVFVFQTNDQKIAGIIQFAVKNENIFYLKDEIVFQEKKFFLTDNLSTILRELLIEFVESHELYNNIEVESISNF